MWSKMWFARKIISAKLKYITVSHVTIRPLVKKNHYIIVILSICDLRVMLEGHTQPEANYDCNLMSINGLYVRKLIMRFLNKNLFCSKGRWRPSWIFVIFGQTQNASFEIKTGDLHQSFFHLNALKNLVH